MSYNRIGMSCLVLGTMKTLSPSLFVCQRLIPFP